MICIMQQGSSGLQKAEKLAPPLLAAMPCAGRLADLCSRVIVPGTKLQLKSCMRLLDHSLGHIIMLMLCELTDRHICAVSLVEL